MLINDVDVFVASVRCVNLVYDALALHHCGLHRGRTKPFPVTARQLILGPAHGALLD